MNSAPWYRSPSRLLRMLLATACLVVCLGWCAGLTLVLMSPTDRIYDFAQEWTSGRDYLAGRPVYSEFPESVREHMAVGVVGPIRYNAHPPVSVLLTLPLAFLEYRPAYLAWAGLSMSCLVVSLWIVLRESRLYLTAVEMSVFLALLLTGSALTHHLIQGQLNLLLLLLITIAWVADRRGRSGLSGLLIGVAAAIKFFPAYLGVLFLSKAKWRGAAGVVIGFAATNLAALAILGGRTYVDYWTVVLPEVGRFRDTWANVSILGFWCRLFDGAYGHVAPVWYAPEFARLLTVICSLLVTWPALRVAWKSHGPAGSDLAFSVALVAMLLVSPITWNHYFVLLVLPLLVAWTSCRGQWVPQAVLAVVALLLLTLNPLWLWDALIPMSGHPDLTPAGAAYVLGPIAAQFYALVAFYLLVVRCAVGAHAAASASATHTTALSPVPLRDAAPPLQRTCTVTPS